MKIHNGIQNSALKRIVALLVFVLWIFHSANGAGLTIVTHGFYPIPIAHDHGWVNAMSDYIADRAGGNAAVYEMIVDVDFFSDPLGQHPIVTSSRLVSPPSENGNAEIIIRLFWDGIANFESANNFGVGTRKIAEAVAPYIYSGVLHPSAELPIHLIGHSRGASVMSELARILGEKGIWVQQLTTLDPHPVCPFDADVQIYENVLFADNYYQNLSGSPNCLPTQIPCGFQIGQSYNRQLTSLADGYDGLFGNHSDVHLWYHGTVNTHTTASNGEQSFSDSQRQAWYELEEARGTHAGFYFSRLGGGSAEQSIVELSLQGLFLGYYNHGNFNTSPVNRISLTRNANEWPSLVKIDQDASGSIQAGNAFPLHYVFQSYDSTSSVSVYLDPDRNPYNSNEIALPLTPNPNPQSATARGTRTVDVSGTVPLSAAPGFYYVYGKITNPNGMRYLYSLAQVRVIAPATSIPTAPATLSATAVSSSQINLSWTDNSANETGFKIERRIGSSSFSQIATRSANVTSFSDTGLAAGTAYSYRVRAYNAAGDSAYSPIASATTQPVAGTTYALTIASSNPSSGVSVSSFVGDGQFAFGTTPTSRIFASGSAVGVTCPSTLAGGLVFQKWQLDGSDYPSSTITPTYTTVSMNGSHTVTAFFGLTPPPMRVLSSLTIEGPSGVDERNSAQYHARATYTDGSSAYVDATATWSDNSTYATISATGLLDASAVSSDRDIEIYATFTAGGVTRTATKYATIYNTDTVPTFTLTLAASHGYIAVQPQMSAYPAGTEVRLIANADGDYVFDRWSGNASGTDRTVYVIMDGNRSVTANFVTDPAYGRLQVNLLPQQAVNEGAEWKYDNFSDWQDSGHIVDGITPRINRYVQFKDIPGWITPGVIQASIIGGQTTVTNATYREILGAVQVTISPEQASVAGARWRLDGGAWTESGVTLPEVSTGNHTVQFLAISGWATPPNQTVSVARGVTTTPSGNYGPPAGFPIITAVSPRTGPIAGGTTVNIDGANFQAGATVSFGGFAAVSVTVVSPTRISAVTPPRASYGSVALSLVSGGQTVTQANGFSYLNALGSNIELVGQIGGNVAAVAVVGNTVYYGEGPGLVVSDFANSAAPVERGRIALPAVVKDVVIVNNIAFVAVGAAGLYAVDVSTPTAPAIVGFFDTEGSASGVAVSGGLACVADGSAGLQILSVTNPAAIVRRGLFDTAGSATRVAVGTIASKQYAFVAEADHDLRVVDVTIPSTPTELPFVVSQGGSGITDVKIVGTTLYISDWASQVRIFDASNPTNLIQIGLRGSVGAGAFIDIVGNRLYTGANSSLRVADLSIMPTPANLGSFDIGSGYCYKLVVTNGLAYVAAGPDGLKVVNVSNPASMSLRSSIQTLSYVEDVWVSGNVAFVGNDSGLHSLDVSNPARPVRLATLPGNRVTDIVVTNGKATLVNFGNNTVRIANVANPASLSLLGTYTGVEAWNVALMGSTPILAGATTNAAHQPKLDVLNISSPANPQSSGSTILANSDGMATAIAIVGNWAFVGRSDWSSGNPVGVDVVSLANPTFPQKVGSAPITNSRLRDVAASKDANYLYVPATNGINVFNVTTKTTPILNSIVMPPQIAASSVNCVQIVGDRLYAEEGGFLFAFDISTPAAPQIIGYYDLPGLGYGIAVTNDLIFVAGSYAGVTILRLKDVDKPTVAITSPTANTAYSTSTALLTLDGTATDDKGVVRVSWENNRGGGGVASGTTNWQVLNIQLAAGVNIITVTAEDANGNLATDILTVTANLPDTTPPVVTITGPKPDDEFVVSTNVITLSGSAADNQAVTNLTWSNNRGGSGTINLTGQNWSVTNLLLALGPNLIQVTATDSSGNLASAAALIFFVPPDTNAPSITIEFPTLNSVYETGFGVLDLSGTAADNVGVTEIRWTSNHGGQGIANGVAPWSVNGISLQPGLNVIEVTATDAAGNTGADALSVIYTPPPLHLTALGMSNGVFRLELSGPQITCVIQVSADLVHWLPLSTNTIPVGGSVIISDPGAGDRPVRFYRAVSLAAGVIANLPTLSATRLGSDLLLSWPTNFAGFTLETATNLPPTSWTLNSISPAIVNGQYTVTNAITGGKKFYRLKK